MHHFNGLTEEKEIKNLPKREQAEKHAYRDNGGVLYIPAEWIRGSLINAFVSRAGNKEGKKTKEKVSPRIMITPPEITLSKEEYDIDIRPVSSGVGKSTTRDMCIRPIISDWSAEGNIITTLEHNEKDMKSMMEVAGIDIGIGSNRINGFGRFMVTEFKRVTD